VHVSESIFRQDVTTVLKVVVYVKYKISLHIRVLTQKFGLLSVSSKIFQTHTCQGMVTLSGLERYCTGKLRIVATVIHTPDDGDQEQLLCEIIRLNSI
jgi:hypothetical protein